MSAIISVENISKQYRLGQVGTGTISHDLNRWWHKVRGKEDPYLQIGESNDRTKTGATEYVWALKDINFEVNKGDVMGFVGRNGAGKSTLLKILSRTTAPTVGQIRIKGRVASLLEVGTGFHPELSGRENIFLNGAILGMTKQEIVKKFDEIVSFSGVERYIDTPVKRYSSGMYVRLAFGVAAHLESEILIVDEVLAVGDAEFQKKCLGKMKDVSTSEGRTVLFVSHNMGSILQLCNKGVMLKNGHLVINDNITNVVNYYINESNSLARKIEKDILAQDKPQFSKMMMTNISGEEKSEYGFDEDIIAKVELFIPQFHDALELAMRLVDRNKRAVFTIHENLKKYYSNGELFMKFEIAIPQRFVTPAQYSWVMCINHPGISIYDLHEDIGSFVILETGSEFSRYEGEDFGVVFAKYSIRKIDN